MNTFRQIQSKWKNIADYLFISNKLAVEAKPESRLDDIEIKVRWLTAGKSVPVKKKILPRKNVVIYTWNICDVKIFLWSYTNVRGIFWHTESESLLTWINIKETNVYSYLLYGLLSIYLPLKKHTCIQKVTRNLFFLSSLNWRVRPFGALSSFDSAPPQCSRSLQKHKIVII